MKLRTVKPQKVAIGTYVSFLWFDVHGPQDPGWKIAKELDLSCAIIPVCGIVVGVSEQCIAVSAALCRDDRYKDTCTNPVIIPWFAIRNFETLKKFA